MLGCDGDGNAGVGSGGGVVAVSAYMGGTRVSGVLSGAGDVLEMSVVRGGGGVCDMCKCLARGGVGVVGAEWVTGLVWALPIMKEHGENRICVCVLVAVVWVVLEESGRAAWARVWEGGVVLCLCVLFEWILCVDGRSRYLYIVLGGYLRILDAPSVQSCCTLSISAS